MVGVESHSIREIDEERWDGVAGNVLSMAHRWLRVTEAHWRYYRPLYLLLEDQHGPCVAVVANTSIAREKNFGWLGWLYQRLSLVIRAPFSTMCNVVVRPGVSLQAVMPELNAALNRLCHQEKRLLVTVGNVVAGELPCWQQAGFLASPQPGVSLLDLPATYEEYLEMLQPRDRHELRRAHRRGEKFGVHFEMGPLVREGEDVYPLFCEVFKSHGVAPEAFPFAAQFFADLEREMGKDVFFIRAYVGDTLAGVSLCVRNGSLLWAPLVGLHYELARPSYLYFLIQDERIRWALEHGIRKICLGRTNEREKKRHGFYQETSWLCFRAAPPVLNRMLSLAFPVARRLMPR